MPTSLINGYTSPESTGKPVVHEDLVKIINQMAQGDVMRFTTSAQRTATFTTLGTSPPVGAVSVLTSTGAVERWTGSGWVAATLPATAGINSITGSGTTLSAVYVDFPSPGSFIFSKLYASSVLRVTFGAQVYATIAGTVADFAVRVSGVDYDIARLPLGTALSANLAFGIARIPGLAPGSYLAQIRWKRISGTGVLTVDGNDWITAEGMEVQ